LAHSFFLCPFWFPCLWRSARTRNEGMKQPVPSAVVSERACSVISVLSRYPLGSLLLNKTCNIMHGCTTNILIPLPSCFSEVHLDVLSNLIKAQPFLTFVLYVLCDIGVHWFRRPNSNSSSIEDLCCLH
jgi:hypothetical protein